MNTVQRILIFVLFFVPALFAQGMGGKSGMGGNSGIGGNSTSKVWSLIQHVAPTSVSCSPTCNITVTSTGASDLLVVFASFPNNTTTISSVSGGGTWSTCASSGCHQGHSTTVGVDLAYCLSSSSGTTTITVTVSANTSGSTLAFLEYSTGGPAAIFDTNGVRDQATTVSNPAGIALTLSGIDDAIVQTTFWVGTVSSISSPYTSPAADINTGRADAGSINTSSGTAPTWTAAAGQGAFSAIAFK